MNFNEVKFDDVYVNEEDETTTFYFTGDLVLLKKLLGDNYSKPESYDGEITGVSISIELPSSMIKDGSRSKYTSVSYSPIISDGNCETDYDWCDSCYADYTLSYSETETLISKALNCIEN